MRLPVPLTAGIEVHKNSAVLDLDGIAWDTIVFEAWFASPATAVKFPVMPRADNIVAVQPAFAKRPTDVVARI
jgi:hypothetical protein